MFTGILLRRDRATRALTLENHLDEPVFACSASTGASNGGGPFDVLRLPPGESAEIFHPSACRRVALKLRPDDGPVDVFSVKVSFCKGWGGKYARRDVFACPCWLEICVLR